MKRACSVSDYKNDYKGASIAYGMAKEWVGKCNSCNKWRTNFDTYKSATRRDEEGKPADFVLACGICSTPIQRKCCASGCPHCGGSGMHPKPSPPTPQCHLCGDATTNLLGDKPTCYGCEHEVMGWEHEHEARMITLYGE